MAEFTGNALVARALREQGADVVFTIVAGPVVSAIGACGDAGVRPIGIHHEQAAVMMAAAHGYVAGKVGVAMMGSGPGVTNAITGAHVAWDNGFPVVILGGSSSLRTRGLMAFQEADSVAMMKPVTKWAMQVESPERIPELIAIAFHKAMSGRPGPVYLDLPANVLNATADETALRPAPRIQADGKPQGDPILIERAAELLLRADRPLLLIGKGVRWSGEEAFVQFRQLVDTLGIPFIASPMGRGFIPDDHPLCVGAARNLAMRTADVALILGARLNWMFAMGADFPPDAKLIHVDIEPEEIGLVRDVAIGIAADAGQVVRQLNLALRGKTGGVAEERAQSPWRQSLQDQIAKNAATIAPLMESDDVPMNHHRLMREIRDFLPRDTIITADGELTMATSRQLLPSFTPASRLNTGANGCIGTGIPFAIGAKLARPDVPVISINGDSAFGFNAMELETALRYGLAVVFVVDNNEGILGNTIERHLFQGKHPDRVGMFVPNARYEKIIEAFGGHGEYVERPEEIRPALERAFACGRAACINVRIDPSAAGPATRRGTRQDMGY